MVSTNQIRCFSTLCFQKVLSNISWSISSLIVAQKSHPFPPVLVHFTSSLFICFCPTLSYRSSLSLLFCSIPSLADDCRTPPPPLIQCKHNRTLSAAFDFTQLSRSSVTCLPALSNWSTANSDMETAQYIHFITSHIVQIKHVAWMRGKILIDNTWHSLPLSFSSLALHSFPFCFC